MKKILELIPIINEKSQFDIVERFDYVKITAQYEKIGEINKSSFVEYFKSIDIKDTILFTFLLCDDIICEMEKNESKYIDKFYESISYYKGKEGDNADFSIEIYITKNWLCGNNINVSRIYFLEYFLQYFCSLSFLGIIDCINKYLNGNNGIVFECDSIEEPFGSKTIYFTNTVRDFKGISIDRVEILTKRNCITTFLDKYNSALIPNDFYIIKRNIKFKEMEAVFEKLNYIYSLIFISNFTQVIGNDIIEIKLDGYKCVQNTFIFNELKINKNEYYEIYKWIYIDGNIYDKVGLARNILTLHFVDDTFSINDNNILKSIESSHKIYLKENIKQYLEVKNKTTEFLQDLTLKFSEVLNEFKSMFKKNIMGIFTYIITIFIMNAVNTENVDIVINKNMFIIFILLILASVVIIIYSYIEFNKNIERYVKQHDNIKKSYKNLLAKKEFDEIFESTYNVKEDVNFMKEQRKTYIIVWAILLVLTTVFIYFISEIS